MKYIVSDKFMLKTLPNDPNNAMFIPIEGTNVSMTKIYKTNELGAFIYKLIESGLEDIEIADAIAKEYDVNLDSAKSDLFSFLNDLEANGVIIRS